MAKKESNRGGAGRNQGRTTTDFRSLDITAIGVELSDRNVEFSATVNLYKCGWCGAVWWEKASVHAISNVENAEPDKDGFYFSSAATGSIPAKAERHGKGCPARNVTG